MRTNWADIVDDERPLSTQPPPPPVQTRRWADEDDDDFRPAAGQLGGASGAGSWFNPSQGPGAGGVGSSLPQMSTVSNYSQDKSQRIEVEYSERDGKAVKITKVYKQKRVTKITNDAIRERASWGQAMFGKCRNAEYQQEFGKNTPVQADEEVAFAVAKEKQLKQSGAEDKFWEQSLNVVEQIMAEQKKKKYDANEMRKRMEEREAANIQGTGKGGAAAGAPGAQQPGPGAQGGDGGGGGSVMNSGWGKGETTAVTATGGQNSTLANKYVPPSLRSEKGGKDGGQDRSQENTLRVANLSEDTREGDVMTLFSSVGYVTRVFMPKHREGERQDMHKGFAFVQFRERSDAEKAIKKLNGHGYDSLILSVNWAQAKNDNKG